LAYVELKYYRDYCLEVRELGDTGWAIHVYTPSNGHDPHKLTIVSTMDAAGLEQVLAQARRVVDEDLGRQASP
jgi:hypothetical protein